MRWHFSFVTDVDLFSAVTRILLVQIATNALCRMGMKSLNSFPKIFQTISQENFRRCYGDSLVQWGQLYQSFEFHGS
jgi:hypothetical protein